VKVFIWDTGALEWVLHSGDVWSVKLVAEGKELLHTAKRTDSEIHVYPIIALEEMRVNG